MLVEAHGKHYENQVTLDEDRIARIIYHKARVKNYNGIDNLASND